ncbi:MAG: hypothetical protein ACUVRL_08595 [Candidatus Saccharicenans sp.]
MKNISWLDSISEDRLLSLDVYRGFAMLLLITEATGLYELLINPSLKGTFFLFYRTAISSLNLAGADPLGYGAIFFHVHKRRGYDFFLQSEIGAGNKLEKVPESCGPKSSLAFSLGLGIIYRESAGGSFWLGVSLGYTSSAGLWKPVIIPHNQVVNRQAIGVFGLASAYFRSSLQILASRRL